MADEAFALSPISARASLPSEEDYDAISQAFMETSRGRWFLGEYAKRNRNADTRMVLDAVERIEQTIAAQKREAADEGLDEALAAIRRAVDQARAAATSAVEDLALDDKLAPVRKGARIIREISWRWREIGADGRICDLLDSQVGAIEAACEQIASSSPQAALDAAFGLIEAGIDAFGDGEAAIPQATEAVVPPNSSAASDQAPAAAAETTRAASVPDQGEAEIDAPVEAVAETVEVADAEAELTDVTVETDEMPLEAVDAAVEAPEIPAEAAGETPEAAEAYDEALLDRVALEMAAPDPAYVDDAPAAAADDTDATQPGEPVIVAETPEPIAAEEFPPAHTSLQPALEPFVEPSPEPSLEPSLGSSLIASGILRKPAASDPLAPIRRLSQAEKIAFFS